MARRKNRIETLIEDESRPTTPGEGERKMTIADIKEMSIDDIVLGENHRAESSDAVTELANSMSKVGLLQPVGVVYLEGKYILAYGYRRLAAAKFLGWQKIAVVVQQNVDADQLMILNLAENVQRRNVSLPEIGRYISLYKAKGYGKKAIAEKLGVTTSFVEIAIKAIQDIPKEYRDKIVVDTGPKSMKGKPGSITIRQVAAISNCVKSNIVSKETGPKLYELATKFGPDFKPERVKDYVYNIESGRAWNEAIEPIVNMGGIIFCKESEIERLKNKYVYPLEAPFKSVRAVFRAILRGEISEQVKGQ